jgi:hypothetical protein
MQINIEQAFAEACTALGESIVRERLLSKALMAEQQKAAKPEATEPKEQDRE